MRCASLIKRTCARVFGRQCDSATVRLYDCATVRLCRINSQLASAVSSPSCGQSFVTRSRSTLRKLCANSSLINQHRYADPFWGWPTVALICKRCENNTQARRFMDSWIHGFMESEPRAFRGRTFLVWDSAFCHTDSHCTGHSSKCNANKHAKRRDSVIEGQRNEESEMERDGERE